jgi:uncharacterized protein (TIGR02594 family)
MTVIMPLRDQNAARLYKNNLTAEGGHYLLGANRHWHGGMHFTIDKPVQAIADGKLIAYRLEQDYLTVDLRHSGSNPPNKYSNSFALIKHELTVKGRTLNYYSLYMHLMPASGYSAKPKMAIPDFIRAMEDSDRDATIDTTEDIPGGLNIRHLKTGEIVTTAPISSEISLDDSSYPDEDLTRYTANVASNDQYKMVTFIDHKDKHHNGYALLDDERVKQNGDNYTIITQEDPLKAADASGLKGLRLRSEKNFDDETIIKILKKGSKVKIKIIDTQWAEVKEIDVTAPEGTAYIYHRNAIKFDENDIDEDLLGPVHCPNQEIKGGDLLGHPGKIFSQNNSLHFEIFSDDSIKDFIKEHADLKEADKTILQVNKGSHIFKRTKVDVPKAVATIKKYSRIKIEESDDVSSEYVKITATDICGVVLRADMGKYDTGASQYEGIKANIEQYKTKISQNLDSSSRLEFLYYANSAGDIKTEEDKTAYRLAAAPIADADQQTYWVKRDLITSQNITTDGTDKGTILFNSLNTLFEANPVQYLFEDESALGSSDEALVDLTKTTACQDSSGDTWYEVKLPFDDKGILHYLSLLNGVNRTNQEKGWVKASDTVLTSPLNWPGFKLAKEEGTGDKDAKIDFTNLSPFFKELFEDIDTDSNGTLSAKEMKAALKDDILADRLSRVIAKHPSEWQADDSLSKWKYLESMVPDKAAFEETKKQIKALTWWGDAKDAGAELPMSPEVHHLHPLSFVEQVALMKPKDLEWMLIAKNEIGVKEVKGSKHNPIIIKYHQATSLEAKTDEIPWCSSFVNWVINKSGYTGTNSALALSWKTWGVEVEKPLYGSIAIIEYGEGRGHVGFVLGVQGNFVLILGGNQKDSVKVSKFNRSKFTKFVLPNNYSKDKCTLRVIEGNYKEIDFKGTR